MATKKDRYFYKAWSLCIVEAMRLLQKLGHLYTQDRSMNQSEYIPTLLQHSKASYSEIHLLLNKTQFLQSELHNFVLNNVEKIIILIDEYLFDPAYQSPNDVKRLSLLKGLLYW